MLRLTRNYSSFKQNKSDDAKSKFYDDLDNLLNKYKPNEEQPNEEQPNENTIEETDEDFLEKTNTENTIEKGFKDLIERKFINTERSNFEDWFDTIEDGDKKNVKDIFKKIHDHLN